MTQFLFNHLFVIVTVVWLIGMLLACMFFAGANKPIFIRCKFCGEKIAPEKWSSHYCEEMKAEIDKIGGSNVVQRQKNS